MKIKENWSRKMKRIEPAETHDLKSERIVSISTRPDAQLISSFLKPYYISNKLKNKAKSSFSKGTIL